VKSLKDALAHLDLARQQDASARESRLSSPSQYFEKGGFEAYREHWQRLVCADKGLLPSAKVVLFAVSWYLNRGTRTAWPSMRLLAKNTGMSPTTVSRSLQMAEDRGHIHIRYQRGSSNNYAPAFKRSVPPGGNGVYRPNETQVYRLSGTEPLKEPLKEPLRGRKGEFDEKGVSPELSRQLTTSVPRGEGRPRYYPMSEGPEEMKP
jgi:Helix-turn-helix domain